MEALAYYDGKIGTPEELTVPFNDRVHFFGDGVYDATVGANGKVYLLQDHLDRFYTSARALDIHIPMPKDELGRLLTDLLAKVDGTTHFVYWQVTRGVETRNHVYAEDLPGKLWVSIRQNHLNDPDVPIKLNTEEDTRFYHCNIKTLNLLPSVAAAQHAKRIGVQETVFHRGDIVTECAHSNVSILKDGVFYSHPNDEFILRGIAKTHMIQACYRLGITVMEKCFTLDDLRNADEIIVTSSSNFCLHACEVDGKPAGGKPGGHRADTSLAQCLFRPFRQSCFLHFGASLSSYLIKYYSFSATRSLALRERGFSASSVSSGKIGFRLTNRTTGFLPQTQTGSVLGHVHPVARSAKVCLTMRSSRE